MEKNESLEIKKDIEFLKRVSEVQEKYNAKSTADLFLVMDQKIDELQGQLDEAIEVIKFYGDTESWYENSIITSDFNLVEYDDEISACYGHFGGKKARDFLNKLKSGGSDE